MPIQQRDGKQTSSVLKFCLVLKFMDAGNLSAHRLTITNCTDANLVALLILSFIINGHRHPAEIPTYILHYLFSLFAYKCISSRS